MKQQLFALLFTSILFSLSAGISFAASNEVTNCKPIYGGGQSCTPTAGISIDKKIIHPTSGKAVDNMVANDVRFKPGQDIRFSITVTNTGATVLKNIQLTDELPAYLTYTGGSANFSQEKHVIRFTIDQLNPSQSKTYEVRTKIVSVSALPQNQGTFCSTNYAGALNKAYVVIADKRSDDSAGFCIQKDITVVPTVTPTQSVTGKVVVIPGKTKGGQQVYEAPETTKASPETGPELFGLIGLLSAGFGGHLLRKKSK